MLRMTNPKPVTHPSLLDSIHYFSEMATTLKYVTSYLHARVTHFQSPIYHEEVKKAFPAKNVVRKRCLPNLSYVAFHKGANQCDTEIKGQTT